MIINETDQYIIFHVPKTGGTSIRNGNFNINHKIKKYWKLPTKNAPDLGHLNLYNFTTYVNLSHPTLSYKMYVVIRDPIERFMSGWNEINIQQIGKKYLQTLNVKTVEQLIDVLLKDKSHLLKKEMVWVCPQHLYCKHIEYANSINIIPFKELSTKCKSLFDLDISHKHKSTKKCITQKYVDKLKIVYQQDYELLHQYF